MPYRSSPTMLERKEARRRRFLESALMLFGEKGYHATTVPDIVKHAETSTGNFYFYFRNKEDIFCAVLDHVGRQLADRLNRAIAAETRTLLQMRAAVTEFFKFLAQHPAQARVLLVETSGLSGRPEKTRRRIVNSHAKSVERALLAAASDLPPLDTATAARCWIGAVYEACRYFLEAEETAQQPNPDAMARSVAEFNLRGIGASSA